MTIPLLIAAARPPSGEAIGPALVYLVGICVIIAFMLWQIWEMRDRKPKVRDYAAEKFERVMIENTKRNKCTK
jgi:4-hydroxybenzoate polyprenyltransferase